MACCLTGYRERGRWSTIFAFFYKRLFPRDRWLPDIRLFLERIALNFVKIIIMNSMFHHPNILTWHLHKLAHFHDAPDITPQFDTLSSPQTMTALISHRQNLNIKISFRTTSSIGGQGITHRIHSRKIYKYRRSNYSPNSLRPTCVKIKPKTPILSWQPNINLIKIKLMDHMRLLDRIYRSYKH